MAVRISSELQRLIFERLRDDPAMEPLVADRIFDGPPSYAEKPYVSFGPSDLSREYADCMIGRTETVQIDVFTSQNRKSVCADIVDTIIRSIDEIDGDLGESAGLTDIYVTGAQIMDDPDLSKHGIVRVEALIDEVHE